MLELNKIHNLDALSGMKLLDDDSIDCIVTSPPYWSLRDYSTEPQIWDGDSECNHEWGEKTVKKLQPARDMSGGFGGKDQRTRGVQASAKAVGMSEGAVAEYINQHRQASSERKVEWAKALGKNVLELWRRE